MNQRLNLNIPQNNTFLLPRDILAAADRLIGMKFGMGPLDDMNHLKNKRIRSVADLLQDQFGLALVHIHPSHYGRICPIDTSEGINVGLIGSLAIHARIGHWGSLEMALDSGVPAIADHEGKIISTDTDKIILSGNGDALGIPLVMYQRSNKNTCIQGPERITNEIPHLEAHLLRNLDKNGIVMLGSWVETGDILVGKLTPQVAKESSYAPEDRLLRAILGIQVSTSKETCLKLPIGGRGRVIDVRWDMPYLQDGRPVDMVFNPLGVPSRMNVGQLFECSLGLAGSLLDRHYRIAPFDERYEQEASRKLVFSELYQASKQTANPWVFEPEYPGKSRIFDGRTGGPFEQPVIIGKPYILKLIHQVDDKIHGRSSGHYALVTQQPLRGRSKQGGQRVGEMEVWALEGFGVAHILQEMLTYKSDHIRARQEVLGTTIIGGTIPKPEDAPESFRLLVRELRSLEGSLIGMTQNFSSMIDRYKHQQLRIGSVSPQQISAWAKKILPNGETVGEVTKPYTFHYKTNKPEKDGLFCERIFGPIKSGICACGNYRVIGNQKEGPKFCEQCGVEFVDSRIRRYQMGYIRLACPVTHVWYLKRLPSYIANLLDKPLKELEGLVYCDV
ncbi:hypothetical protein GOBAR_DD17726 [Gossypium barbadense]|nr:hypothetical protein GOBAR_DD17726 [Gossypium barbadense]